MGPFLVTSATISRSVDAAPTHGRPDPPRARCALAHRARKPHDVGASGVACARVWGGSGQAASRPKTAPRGEGSLIPALRPMVSSDLADNPAFCRVLGEVGKRKPRSSLGATVKGRQVVTKRLQSSEKGSERGYHPVPRTLHQERDRAKLPDTVMPRG